MTTPNDNLTTNSAWQKDVIEPCEAMAKETIEQQLRALKPTVTDAPWKSVINKDFPDFVLPSKDVAIMEELESFRRGVVLQKHEIISLEGEFESLRSQLQDLKLAKDNAELLLRQAMKTNVEMTRKLEIAKDCMKFYVQFFPNSDGKVAREMLQKLSEKVEEEK